MIDPKELLEQWKKIHLGGPIPPVSHFKKWLKRRKKELAHESI